MTKTYILNKNLKGLYDGVFDPAMPWAVEDYKALERLEQRTTSIRL